jgi:hypothetical protein
VNQRLEPDTVTCESLAQIEEHVQCRLNGRVHDFRLVVRNEGLVLLGHAHTYYAKQLAQQTVMEAWRRPPSPSWVACATSALQR